MNIKNNYSIIVALVLKSIEIEFLWGKSFLHQCCEILTKHGNPVTCFGQDLTEGGLPREYSAAGGASLSLAGVSGKGNRTGINGRRKRTEL